MGQLFWSTPEISFFTSQLYPSAKSSSSSSSSSSSQVILLACSSTSRTTCTTTLVGRPTQSSRPWLRSFAPLRRVEAAVRGSAAAHAFTGERPVRAGLYPHQCYIQRVLLYRVVCVLTVLSAGWPDPGCWHGDKEYPDTWCDFGCAKAMLDPTGKFTGRAPDRQVP